MLRMLKQCSKTSHLRYLSRILQILFLYYYGVYPKSNRITSLCRVIQNLILIQTTRILIILLKKQTLYYKLYFSIIFTNITIFYIKNANKKSNFLKLSKKGTLTLYIGFSDGSCLIILDFQHYLLLNSVLTNYFYSIQSNPILADSLPLANISLKTIFYTLV